MTAKLRFDNRNKEADVLEIYRTDTSVAKPGEEFLIASIAGNATEYKDTSAVLGNTYYYVTAAMISGRPDSRIYGRPFKITIRADRGPGPNEVIIGNDRLGYMGLVDKSLLPSVSVFKQYGEGVQVHTGWLKFVRKGKIIFMPNFALVGSPQLLAFNQPGYRSGFPNSKKPASYPPGIFDDNIATIEGYRFHVRLVYGTKDDWTPASSPTGSPPHVDSEAFELLSFCNVNSGMAGLKVPSVSQLGNASAAIPAGTIFAELSSGSNATTGTAFTSGSTSSNGVPGLTWAMARMTSAIQVNGMSSSSFMGAFMVLELIED